MRKNSIFRGRAGLKFVASWSVEQLVKSNLSDRTNILRNGYVFAEHLVPALKNYYIPEN